MGKLAENYINDRLMKIKNRRNSIRAERAALEKECELMDKEEFDLICLQEKLQKEEKAYETTKG